MKARYRIPITVVYYLALSLVMVYPLYKTGFLFNGYDQVFHLSRAHELATAFKAGHFGYSYAMNSFNDVGQAVGVFYPSLSVLVLAIFQLLFSNLVLSTYMAVFVTVFLGLLISHYAIMRLKKGHLTAAIFSSLYIGSTIFLNVCFVWFDMGWLWALIFIPLVLSGFVQIFAHRSATVTDFVIGIAALLLSHIVSFFVVLSGLVVVTVIIAFYRSDFYFYLRKFILGGLVAMGCTAFFLIKFVRIYLTNTISGVNKIDSSFYALKPGTIFTDSLNNTSVTGNIGAIILLVLIVLLTQKNKFDLLDGSALAGSILCLFLSSSLFPWIHVQKYLGSFIQYPVRFLSVAMVGLAFVTADVLSQMLSTKEYRFKTLTTSGLALGLILTAFSSATELSSHLDTNDQLRTPSINVLAQPSNKFNENAAKHIFSERFLMAGQFDYWPQQSIKFGQDIIRHVGAINGKKVRLSPTPVKNGLSYHVSLKKGDQVDLPLLSYGDGLKVPNGLKVTTSHRGTVLITSNKPVKSIVVERTNSIIDILANVVSVLVAISFAFLWAHKKFGLKRIF